MRAERRFIERGLNERFRYDERSTYPARQASAEEEEAGNNMG